MRGHVLCAPYSYVINASWTSVISRPEHAVECLVPNLQMFLTHEPPPPPKGAMGLPSVVDLEW